MAGSKRLISKSISVSIHSDYHYEDDKKIVDRVAPIRPIKDEDANEAFFNAEEGTMVYHTANEDFIIHIRKGPLMKGRKI